MTMRDWIARTSEIHGMVYPRCACCGNDLLEDGVTNRDHDHRTGWARGLTCYRCNHQLLRNHTLASARMIVAYLERVERFYSERSA